MKVTCRLELADFRAFERALLAHKPLGAQLLNRFSMVLVLFFASVFIIADPRFRLRFAFNPARELVIIALVYGFFVLVFFGFSRFQKKFTDKKLLATAMFREPVIFEINEDGVIGNDADGQNFTRWNAVKDVWNEAEHIIVLLNENHGLFIPKRAFDSPQDAQNFAAFAQNQWEKAHPLPPGAPPISDAK